MSCTSVWVLSNMFSPKHRNPLALAHHCNAVGCAYQKRQHIAECITILVESNLTERTGFQWSFNAQKSFRNLRMQSCVSLGWTRYLVHAHSVQARFSSISFSFLCFSIASVDYFCSHGCFSTRCLLLWQKIQSTRIYHKISSYLAWFCEYHTMIPCQQSSISTRLW